ncbi:hypothetical protein COCCADRAFT_23859 [Bipolaris zeicola 26-R-13]|uniref:Uncharacterized protein n=1 Tax=Cochliobolus carbonum (strain 26-R-13) TaxID=930089 RepID=W6YF25_COCC2|nr:uncharacterized protein COCCADRAFT_23859 [Bipolaris zeicola 26-R-13]EUC36260.1 hypothetical protein COCCADRAFT_23859 [Bipolaris zeicola 26-R-13]
MADKQQGAANDRLRPPTAETLVMVDWGGVAARKPLDGMAVGCMAGNRSMLTRHGMRLSTAARRGGKHHETTDNGGVGAGSRVVEGSRRAAGSTNQRPGGRLKAQCTRPRSAAAMEAALGGLSLHWHTTAGGLDCAPSVCVCVCVCECVCVCVGEGSQYVDSSECTGRQSAATANVSDDVFVRPTVITAAGPVRPDVQRAPATGAEAATSTHTGGWVAPLMRAMMQHQQGLPCETGLATRRASEAGGQQPADSKHSECALPRPTPP